VSGLVVRGLLTIGGAQHDLPLGSEDDLLERIAEVIGIHPLVPTPRREKCRPVTHTALLQCSRQPGP
jgi:hypothetical protein